MAAAVLSDQVIEILAAQALRAPGSIDPGDRLDAVGLDSLGMVESLFALEERFDISIPFNPNVAGAEQADTTPQSVAELIALIAALVAEKAR